MKISKTTFVWWGNSVESACRCKKLKSGVAAVAWLDQGGTRWWRRPGLPA